VNRKRTIEDRRERIERIFNDMGWEDIERLDEWDGDDIEALRELLSEEEFDTLLDELPEEDLPSS
jgi:uncharacterized protein (DUF2267 family)